jgi:hypothetical protein
VIRPAARVETPAPPAEPLSGTAEEPVAGSGPPPAEEPDEDSPAAASLSAISPKEEARQALKADIEARQRAAADTVDKPDSPRPTPAPKKPTPAREPVARDRRRLLRWAGLIVVIASAAWLAGRWLGGGPEGETAAAGPDGASVAQPVGEVLNYSVAIESYEDYDAAMVRADSLALAAPDLSFYVVPVRDDDDSILYRVLAGPMTDSATASAAMQRLVQEELKIALSEYDVRSTPLAFLVGQYEFRGDAEARMNELEARSVPSYTIEVPQTQGAVRYNVYAGAYSGPSEAALMRDRLREAGVEDTLVLRVGRSQP